MSTDRTPNQHAIARAILDATLPGSMAVAAMPALKATPEYEQARREGRARKWLEAEATSVGYSLAELLTDRLDNLDPHAGED